MKHHAKSSTALLLASMWAVVAACDADAELEPAASVEAQGAANVVVEDEATLTAETKAEAAAKAGFEVEMEPASFDLEAVTAVVEAGEIESAAELEVVINDAARGYNHIDIDADGKIDHVQVVEVKALEVEAEAEAELAGDVAFELRVVPSSTHSVEAGVTFATVTFARHPVNSEVEIRAGFTAVVHQPEVHVYTRVVPVRIEAGVFVGGSVFLSWLYAVERPVYVGIYEVDGHGHWIPPGHVKHGHWKATGETSAHGDVHGHGKVKGKTDGRFVVEIRGGTSSGGRIDLGGSSKSSKSHGGSSKSSKSHDGGSSKSSKSQGGSSKSKSKGK